MKAQKSNPYPNGLMAVQCRKVKNTRQARFHENKLALLPTCAHLITYQINENRLAHVKTLQARIDANAYCIDSTATAQQMLKSSVMRRMLDVEVE